MARFRCWCGIGPNRQYCIPRYPPTITARKVNHSHQRHVAESAPAFLTQSAVSLSALLYFFTALLSPTSLPPLSRWRGRSRRLEKVLPATAHKFENKSSTHEGPHTVAALRRTTSDVVRFCFLNRPEACDRVPRSGMRLGE